jgi:hypothetical protein
MLAAQPSLSNFLLDLSRNPDKLRQFQQNPQAAAQQAGLSESAVQAILTKNSGAIQKAVRAEKPSGTPAVTAGDIEVVIVVVI